MDGEVIANHLQPKDTLDMMRHLARGKSLPIKELCDRFNKETNNGKNMSTVSQLLEDSIMSIIDAKDQSDIDSFFGGGQTTFLSGGFSGLDDFEPVSYTHLDVYKRQALRRKPSYQGKDGSGH